MSKAEEFIRNYTRNCSNYTGVINKKTYEGYYVPWLTPDQAKRAVEIAREEIYEWLKENMYMYNGECEGDRKAIIDDLKQAMKNE